MGAWWMVDEWMSGWVNGWMGGWWMVDEWMGEWVDGG